MTEKLSTELKVACEIWHQQFVERKPVWFSKLVELLSWCMTKEEVSRSIDTLCDWCIIYGEYGETVKGRAGRLLLIDLWDTNPDGHRMKLLYEQYWKGVRQ